MMLHAPMFAGYNLLTLGYVSALTGLKKDLVSGPVASGFA